MDFSYLENSVYKTGLVYCRLFVRTTATGSRKLYVTGADSTALRRNALLQRCCGINEYLSRFFPLPFPFQSNECGESPHNALNEIIFKTNAVRSRRRHDRKFTTQFILFPREVYCLSACSIYE